MHQYKLTYFDGKGRGELSRMLFAMAGQDYEDKRLEFKLTELKPGEEFAQMRSCEQPKTELKPGKEFEQMRSSLPFGQVPLLEVDGKVICQSRAIGRYLARQFGLAGKTAWDRAIADMIADTMEDLVESLVPIYFAKDENKAEMLKAFHEGPFLKALTVLEKILDNNGSGFFVGDEITWADVTFYLFTEKAPPPMKIQVDRSRFPKCAAILEKVEIHPKIAEWIKKRPNTPY